MWVLETHPQVLKLAEQPSYLLSHPPPQPRNIVIVLTNVALGGGFSPEKVGEKSSI